MKSIFSFWISLLMIFGIAQIGTEVYKAYEQKQMIEMELFSMAMDAMELTMVDSFRMEHISHCDTNETEAVLKSFIRSRFKLNHEFKVESQKDWCVTKIETTSLQIFEGSYTKKGDFYEQDQLPYIAYKGLIEMELQVLKFKKRVEIPISMKIIAHRV